MNELLAYQSIEIAYHETPVIHDLSFSLKAGEILGIVGESGSGKSTLVHAALDLLGKNGRVTKGEILFKQQNLLTLSRQARRQINGAEIGMVFQDSEKSLCAIRTIRSQLYDVMNAHSRMAKKEVDDQVLELFSKLGFANGAQILESYPFELSGGMNQRVGIVMAILKKPAILLADEPTSALDASVQKQVLQELLVLCKLYGMAMIIITHNMGVIEAVADTVMVMKDGQQVEYGEVEQVLTAPKNSYTKQLLAAVPKLRRK